jgi:hypothetical protein
LYGSSKKWQDTKTDLGAQKPSNPKCPAYSPNHKNDSVNKREEIPIRYPIITRTSTHKTIYSIIKALQDNQAIKYVTILKM